MTPATIQESVEFEKKSAALRPATHAVDTPAERRSVRAPLPLHPLLFAMVPIATLYCNNILEVTPRELIWPVLLVLTATMTLWLGHRLIVRDFRAAAIATSVALFCAFLYGPLLLIRNYATIRPLYVFGFWLLISTTLYLFCIVRLRRTGTNPGKLTSLLNWTGFVALAIPLAQGVTALAGSTATNKGSFDAGAMKPLQVVAPIAEQIKPDIYYIILDAYAREDVLRDEYDYDNSPFLNRLRDRGFYIANESYSNYSYTHLSLASSLNLVYLEELAKHNGYDDIEQLPHSEMIRHSRWRRFLEGQGYQIVALQSAVPLTDTRDADVYLSAPWLPTEFQSVLMDTTVLGAVLRHCDKSTYDLFRHCIHCQLAALPKAAKVQSPKFVFAHIICPHNPFVIGAQGEDLDPEAGPFSLTSARTSDGSKKFELQYRSGYRAQVQGLSKYFERALDGIFANLSRPSIIIVQADHSARLRKVFLNNRGSREQLLKETYGILNAIYLPGDASDRLYPSISPVNIFRFILNEYFGGEMPLLEDRQPDFRPPDDATP